MLINEQTKIAALLKHHPDALEKIISLSSDFKKLRNPLLRKLMAGRTSIAMASKIGGCLPEDFFKILAPLGFEKDKTEIVNTEKPLVKTTIPHALSKIPKDKIIVLDVREMLANENDPLKLIQQKIKSLATDQALKIINTFEPIPLIKLLEKQGFQYFVEEFSENQIDTYFYSTNDAMKENATRVEENKDSHDWDLLLDKYKNHWVETDVQHLEMPMPMMTILENLDHLPKEKALFVYHKRIPVFLLTELKDRNFDYRIKEIKENEVHMIIYHQTI